MSFKIMLYTNTAENNRVDKSQYLTKLYDAGIDGVLREDTSLINPIIIINLDVYPTFNYVQIGTFDNRFYFVTDIVSKGNNLWEIHLSIDVLHTYREKIYLQQGFIDRCSTEWNDNIVDSKIVLENGYDVSTTTVSNNLFVQPETEAEHDNNFNYILLSTATYIQ